MNRHNAMLRILAAATIMHVATLSNAQSYPAAPSGSATTSGSTTESFTSKKILTSTPYTVSFLKSFKDYTIVTGYDGSDLEWSPSLYPYGESNIYTHIESDTKILQPGNWIVYDLVNRTSNSYLEVRYPPSGPLVSRETTSVIWWNYRIKVDTANDEGGGA